MIISETLSFNIGRYVVHQRPRPDNPAWSVYIVMLGTRIVGRSFSMPDLSCCEWLERENGVYATNSAPLKREPLRGVAKRKALAAT